MSTKNCTKPLKFKKIIKLDLAKEIIQGEFYFNGLLKYTKKKKRKESGFTADRVLIKNNFILLKNQNLVKI